MDWGRCAVIVSEVFVGFGFLDVCAVERFKSVVKKVLFFWLGQEDF